MVFQGQGFEKDQVFVCICYGYADNGNNAFLQCFLQPVSSGADRAWSTSVVSACHTGIYGNRISDI